MSLSNQELESIKTRLGKATAGEWKADTTIRDGKTCVEHPKGAICEVGWKYGSTTDEEKVANADFISHSKQDIESLLGEVGRLNAHAAVNEPLLDNFKRRCSRLEAESQRYRTALEIIAHSSLVGEIAVAHEQDKQIAKEALLPREVK